MSGNGPSMEESAGFLRTLLQRNDKHAKEMGPEIYGPLATGQKPKVAIAWCADSRVHSVAFAHDFDHMKDVVNGVFVGRDIGNTYNDSEGIANYAVNHLGVPILVVMGHTGCGAIAASAGDYSGEAHGIQTRLDKLGGVTEGGASCAQNNVDHQVGIAIDKYQEKVQAGELVVLGAMFDLTGEFGGSPGKIYITNVNGTSDASGIREHTIFKGYDARMLEETVQRLE